tara:strand:+ start:4375 stop:4593 length:219 start_codon:yes stop_codon:yes gene_type:complete
MMDEEEKREMVEIIEECENLLKRCLATLVFGQEIMTAMLPIAKMFEDECPQMIGAINAYIEAVEGVDDEVDV